MGIFASTDEVSVELECPCEGTPHDRDTVWLRAELSPDGGLAASALMYGGAPSVETMTGNLGRVWLVHGITRWTFVDDKGQPIPCNPFSISRLKWEIVRPVAEKADSLYAEAILRPLVASLSKSSRNGQTGASTSASPPSSTKRQKRSKRSTTATTPPSPPATTTSA